MQVTIRDYPVLNVGRVEPRVVVAIFAIATFLFGDFMYVKFNPNPRKLQVGDCVIRALSKALNKDWEETYIDLCLQGLIMCDMPSANHVWGTYLREHGFERHLIPDEHIDSYTVEDFCKDHLEGIYVLPLSSHVVCVVDGNYYDSWNSGEEVPLYFWEKRR